MQENGKGNGKGKIAGIEFEEEGGEGGQVKKSISTKKPRESNEEDGVRPAKCSTLAIIVSGVDQGKGKEVAPEPRKVTKSSSASLKLKPFIEDVVQAFPRSTLGKSISPPTDLEKFCLAYNQSAMVSFYSSSLSLIRKFEILTFDLNLNVGSLHSVRDALQI